MTKSKDDARRSFQPEWKSIGIGVAVGMLLMAVLMAAGGRVEEWNFGIMKVVIPTATLSSTLPEDQAHRPIESFPITVFDYDGFYDAQIKQGTAELTMGYSEGAAQYLFDYELPLEDGVFGYAGLDFRFDPPQDLSEYKTIEVVLNYFDDTTSCELFIKDISFHGNYVLLSKQPPAGGTVQINGTEYIYEIPLTAFQEANLKATYEVGLSVDTDITKGKKRIAVEQIAFLK
jgi:hypothetical protein